MKIEKTTQYQVVNEQEPSKDHVYNNVGYAQTKFQGALLHMCTHGLGAEKEETMG